MIPFDFEYYKPDTVEEAAKLFDYLKNNGIKPLYYGGGTEIISMARAFNVYTEAVIDLKGIPECNTLEVKGSVLIIGSSVTLTQIAEANLFPLLSLVVQRIADHTIQDKITLGGNLSGTIIYKEAILPLLICDSEIVLASSQGRRQVLLRDIFDKKINFNDNEFIVGVGIETKYLSMPYLHAKRTKSDKIDYPLITLAAIKDKNIIKLAFSGLCRYPFREVLMENCLNDVNISINERVNNAINNIPDSVLSDLSGTADYRKFILQGMLIEVLERLGDK